MPDIQIPGIVISGLQVILAFTGAFTIALWLSLIVWTFRDARSRSRDAFAILLATLMTVIFGPLGLLIYFLLRPPITLAELYERSLEEEALLQDLEERPRCAGCSRVVDTEWVVCPDCHTQLKRICLNCGNGLHLRWNICPYCGVGVNQSGLLKGKVSNQQKRKPFMGTPQNQGSAPVQTVPTQPPSIQPTYVQPPTAQSNSDVVSATTTRPTVANKAGHVQELHLEPHSDASEKPQSPLE